MSNQLELQEGFTEFASAPDRRRSPQVELGTEWYLHTLGEGKALHLFWIESTQELVAAELAGPASVVMPGGYVHASYTGRYVMLGQYSARDIEGLVGIDGGVLDMFILPNDGEETYEQA